MQPIRLTVSLILFFLAFFFPWWLFLILVLGAFIFFDNYLEIIFFGFILDILYSPESGFYRFLFLFISMIVFILGTLIKERARFNS